METNKTDRTKLIRGIKILVFAILTLFTGPIFLHIALSNKEKPLYIPILIFGCLISAMAVFLVFKGIKAIINSLFNKKP